MSLARGRRAPVQDLSGAFEAAAVEDGEGAAVDGGVARDAVGRHGVGAEHHSEELLGKLALNAWLTAQEPQRSVARPPSFYDTIVDVL